MDAADSIGADTPLHVAARCGDSAVASLLLRLGSVRECSAQNAAGDDAASTATRSGHAALARGLQQSLACRRRFWVIALCALLSSRRAECIAGPPTPVQVERLSYGAGRTDAGEETAGPIAESAESGGLTSTSEERVSSIDQSTAICTRPSQVVSVPSAATPATLTPEAPACTGDAAARCVAIAEESDSAAPGMACYPTMVYPWPPPSIVDAPQSDTRQTDIARPFCVSIRYAFSTPTVAHAICALSELPLPLLRHVVTML